MMNKAFRVVVALLIVSLLGFFTYTFLNMSTQVNKILAKPLNNKNCASLPTDNFLDGDKIEHKYIYHRCRLSPDFMVLIFYCDLDNHKIVNRRLLNANYEEIAMASPYFCSLGFSNKDMGNYYERCSVRMIYDSILMENDFFFSTPSRKINNKDTIRSLEQKHPYNLDNVDMFDC